MSSLPTEALTFFIIANVFAVCATLINAVMHNQVNRRLPDEEQISHLIGHYWKFRKIWRLHRQFCPRSHLRLVLTTCIAAGMVFLLATACKLGFL